MTDAHCHIFDLLESFPGALKKNEKLPAACAANSWNREQFEFHEGLSKNASEKYPAKIIPCFGIHPQLPANRKLYDELKTDLPALPNELAGESRLGAVGETGFDLYDETHRSTEKIQEELFLIHIETAHKYGLPLVIHSRRAMHKIFPFTNTLKKLPSVIFHSWPGTLTEAESLIRRGVNVFFSFGAILINNHREAMRCVSSLPAERLLFETDSPYQPPRGKTFSSWEDLARICETAAVLRREAQSSCGNAEELETVTDENFRRAFSRRYEDPE